LRQGGGDRFTSRHRDRIRRSRTARLVGNRDAASPSHHAAQCLETIDHLILERDRVDGQNLIERCREHWQAVNGTEPQIDPARPNGGNVAPRGLTQHFFGVVETDNVPLRCEAADFPYRDSRSETDLQNSIMALDVKQ
jgi:hypothetical protein